MYSMSSGLASLYISFCTGDITVRNKKAFLEFMLGGRVKEHLEDFLSHIRRKVESCLTTASDNSPLLTAMGRVYPL